MRREKGNIGLIILIVVILAILAVVIYKAGALPGNKTTMTQPIGVVATSSQNQDIAKDLNSIQVGNPDNSLSDVDSDLQKL